MGNETSIALFYYHVLFYPKNGWVITYITYISTIRSDDFRSHTSYLFTVVRVGGKLISNSAQSK